MRDFGFYEKFGYKLGLHDVTTKKKIVKCKHLSS